MPASTRRVITADTDEDGRYHRQELISWWDQDRLASAKVLVAGAGALGNELVKNLALIGVGTVVVADLDIVENSNLARCVFFRENDEGEPKATILAKRVQELNSEIDLIPVVGDIRTRIGLGVFSEIDLVLAGLDNREARLFVNKACWKTSTPWVDGAMEGLMGVARLFTPPEGPCYECTMSAADLEMVARRRACSLLTRDEMIEGKVPTTATTSSVIAGIQVQEAIKLLHSDRLNNSAGQSGTGYQYVGASANSYLVRYERREECLAHDTYDLDSVEAVDTRSTFGSILETAQSLLGPKAILDLEHDIAVEAMCQKCGSRKELLRPLDALDVGSGVCVECGAEWRIDFTHTVASESRLLPLTPAQVGLPTADFVTGRAGDKRLHYQLTGDRSALGCLEQSRT